MTADEKEVREHYDCVVHEHGIVLSSTGVQVRTWPEGVFFVRERKRQIAEVEEEIALVRDLDAYYDYPPFLRILAREEAALAELLRGMR